ncbi:retrovirus-related Pol polyprotein from transposon 412 [Trichonephila clavipes]|nr:retrovirus-related Pol polyprotein from transposon 412 [Trichonephila clavipes]
MLQEICYILNIHQSLIPVYHPQANPVEWKNRDLKPRQAILVQDKHDCWSEKLPFIRFALNRVKCETTGQTAAFLNFSRDITSAEQRCARKNWKLIPRRDGPYVILTQRSPSYYEIASLDNPGEPLDVYHTSALTPCNNDRVKPLIPLRKRGRPPKVNRVPLRMDFTEINSRGKRRVLLGRIDRQNSRFLTAKTIIVNFGLHASFDELESAKNAVNEGQGSNPREDMDICKCIVPAWHGGTLNSRRSASPLVRLVEEEEKGGFCPPP